MSGFGFDIAVEGEESIEGLYLALKKLPLSLTSEVHINALKKAAKPLMRAIDLSVPEDTGLLASDLRIAKTKYPKDGEHQIIVGFRKRSGGHGYLAHFHEYGTSKMPAKPFMRPSDDKTKSIQERIYEEQLQKEVDKRIDGL